MNYELIIIGGGPAGMSAAIYAARKKIRTLLLSTNLGGQMLESYQVDNYLGAPKTPGLELVNKFIGHLKNFEKTASAGAFDLEIKEGVAVKNIKQAGPVFQIHTTNDIFEGKAVIIATGKTERKLEIPGAKEFEGKGISYCATCDAPLFRDKIVAVIGGGDAGQDTAWQLTSYATKIYLLNRYQDLKGDDKDLQERLKKEAKIEILSETEPIKILGDKFVSGLVYKNFRSKEEIQVAINGIFVEIGSTPASLFLDQMLRCNNKEEIITDHNTGVTSVPGIFAAGDVTDSAEKQIIIAAGEGAKATLAAYNYLKNK
jgi:thioredoxin reductase